MRAVRPRRRHPAGADAERAAERFLLRSGLTLTARNYHCRYGEIDLIMQHKFELVFVEVRSRRNRLFGGAASSVGHRKQRNLIQTAHHYLAYCCTDPQTPCRFDVVAVTRPEWHIEWIENAFALTD
ncbi:MAG: YraN family protein [Pseudomonadota bacterium]